MTNNYNLIIINILYNYYSKSKHSFNFWEGLFFELFSSIILFYFLKHFNFIIYAK